MNFLTKLNENNIIRSEESVSPSRNILNTSEELPNNSDTDSEHFFDASCDSTDNKSEMNRKKKLRVIEIKDQIEIEEQLDGLEIKSNHSNDRNVENSREAKELIQKRRELGDEWLISLRPSLESCSSSQKTLTADMNISSVISESTSNDTSFQSAHSTIKPDYNRKISTISTNTTRR